MPWNGDGTFTRTNGVNTGGTTWQSDRDAGAKILATRHDTHDQDLADGINDTLKKDGGNAATGDLNLGGNRFTNAGDGTARDDLATVGQVQNGENVWADAGGTADALTATYSPAITALVDGMELRVRAGASNTTTTPTFSPNGFTARTIVKTGGNALVAGDIAGDGHELILRYDLSNTRWELLNPADATVTRSDIGVANIRANGVLAPHHNLVLQNGSTAASQVDITADGLIVTDTSGNQVLLSSVSETADITTSGAGGLDTGSEANSTFYHVWIIYDGTNTDALLSTSTTFAGLTLPSGYTYAAYCGAMYNDGSGNFISLIQRNRVVARSAQNVLNNGNATSYTSVDLSDAVPTTAIKATGRLAVADANGVNATLTVAATSGGLAETVASIWHNGTTFESSPFAMALVEEQTIYYKMVDGGERGVIVVSGWEF